MEAAQLAVDMVLAVLGVVAAFAAASVHPVVLDVVAAFAAASVHLVVAGVLAASEPPPVAADDLAPFAPVVDLAAAHLAAFAAVHLVVAVWDLAAQVVHTAVALVVRQVCLQVAAPHLLFQAVHSDFCFAGFLL